MQRNKSVRGGLRRISTSFILPVALLAFSACSRGTDVGSGATPDPETIGAVPIAVETVTVTGSRLVTEIRGSGLAEGIREAWVVSETEGPVAGVNFDLGDRVKAGQVLLSVDTDLVLRNRDLAEQQFRTAELEFEAARSSFANGSMSALQFSRTTDRLLAAEAAKASAEEAWDNSSLKAPFDGVVALRDRSLIEGTVLGRGVRTALIVDDSAFRVEIGVGEGQLLLVEEGARAGITGNDGITRYGSVTAIAAGSDAGSYPLVVEWTPEDGDRLRSGMSVDVSIAVDAGEEKVIIPASAIRIRGGEEYVFLAVDGITEARRIRSGSRLGERIEVLEGLSAGEVLVTTGLASITPGAPLSVTVVGLSGDA